MIFAAVDFETFYTTKYSVQTMAVDVYCRHEEFDPYMVSIYAPDLDIAYVGPPKDAPWAQIKDLLWVSHNAAFDRQVYRAWRKPKFPGSDLSDLEPDHANWQCSANCGVYFQLPRSLAAATEVVFGNRPDKSVRDNMRHKHYADLDTDAKIELAAYALSDAKLCHMLFAQFIDDWPIIEQKLSLHLIQSGIDGIAINEGALDKGIETLGKVRQNARQGIPWAYVNKAGKEVVASLKQLSIWCKTKGIPPPLSIADGDWRFEKWLEEWEDQVPQIALHKRWLKSNRGLALLNRLDEGLRDDSSIGFGLLYFGAEATGRWAGSGKLNMQNLAKVPLYDVDFRAMFVARPKHKLILCDLAQIEPRILARLSHDFKFLELVAEGQSVYEAHARLSMGYDAAEPLKTKNPKQYAMAKMRVIALGYGCGSARFADQAGISEDLAKSTVDQFRESNPLITTLWRHSMANFVANRDTDMAFRLLSKRIIRYYKILFEADSAKPGWYASTLQSNTRRRHWYGGKLVENLVQATARDVFAHGYVAVLDAGYKVLWSVHDELICEVPEADAEDAAKDIERIMSRPPPWLNQTPLGAEAKIRDCYEK